MLYRWLHGWTVIALLLLVLVLRPIFVNQAVWHNAGYIFLNHGFKSFQDDDLQQVSNQRAEVYLQRAADLPIANLSVARGLGQSLAFQGKLQDAIVVWHLVPEMASELMQFGHQARGLKQYSQAMQWYNWASKLRSGWRDPVYYMGLTQAEMGNGNAALPYYETVLLLPHNYSDVTDPEVYCALAWVYHWLLDSRNPEQALLYYDLALVKDVTLFQNIDGCRFKRAELLLWTMNDFDRAVEDYKVLSQRQLQNVLVLTNLTLAKYRQMKDLTVAEAELTAVITMYPDEPWGYWRLADVYREAGLMDKAQVWYERTLLILPGNKEVQAQLEQLEKP